ncbi:hypothetical protein [Vibrio crassostreae]|uniref:hypothetical protein n=1 Tax=Vibrio crassostreae TaxID=246167 RepID=UPI001B30E2FE|nr:hypothetical protein [Vibrio crassostreae]
MAKSPMAALLKQPRVDTSKEVDEVSDISMSLIFALKNGKVSTYNLGDLCHLECDPSKELANPRRFYAIRKIYKKLRNSGMADSTKQTYVANFRRYLTLCDRLLLNPFERKGIEGILGIQGELSRQEKLAREPMPFLFNYSDGSELGIKSTSANSFSSSVKELLVDAGCPTSTIEKYARRPNLPFDAGTTDPHTDTEFKIIISRVQSYFFSLGKAISEHFDKHGEIPLKLNDISIGVSGYEGDKNDVEINLSSRSDKPKNINTLPFNQMMVSAYVLFCYYTSFNDTQIRDVRHPLSIVTQRREGRTEKYVKVKGYKARSGSDVEAYFLGIVKGEIEDSEAKGNDAGFFLADFLKRGRHKNTDGLTFINTFSELSRKCNPEKHGKLFYCIDSTGNVRGKFDLDKQLRQLVLNLGLLSEDRAVISSYLSSVICRYLDKGEWERFRINCEQTGFSRVSRELMTDKLKVNRVHSLIYTFVRSLTNIPLKGALIPLTFKECETTGDVEVFLKYEDGMERSFITSKRYIDTLKKIEARAETFNPLKRALRGRKVTRPAYFLPMGVRSETYQWQGHEMPVRHKVLQDIGIGNGIYHLSTGSRRIRAKNSDNLYTDADGGRQARDILQHSKGTQGVKYVNGHPTANMRQVSQGLSAIGHIAEGDSVEQAKDKVRKRLEIKVLAYDDWKQSKLPSNPNGVACNGKIDLTEGKNEHYAAQKFAEEHGFINEGEDITCYQYDLCIFCKNMQLIDDVKSVYKLISFIDSLYDSIEKMPERSEFLVRRIERYESLLGMLPEGTLDKAELFFEENGRYFLFK